MKFHLKRKKILVVEDYSVMRTAIREMLYGMEASHIQEVDSGSAAIASMNNTKFDIVLCDYNLGIGKNGLQVLEEARHLKLLPYYSLFIMITAEQDPGIVLGAVDYRPDEYLAKPFTAQQLLTRIERNTQRKTFLSSVERELDKGNLQLAIEKCEALLNAPNHRMRSQLLKLRAELAIESGDFNAAKVIYENILEQREINWARLGLGKIFFLQENIEQAANVFLQVIEHNPMLMEAYDWLARTYETAGEYLEAQETLYSAVNLSPQAILRQKKLATIAETTGELEIALKAYKAAVKLGKFSVHKSPSDFSGLAKAYHKSDSANHALKILDEMLLEFKNLPEAELRAAALKTVVYQDMGKTDLAEQACDKSTQLIKQIDGPISKDLRLDVAEAYYSIGATEKADHILDELVKNYIDEDLFIARIQAMYESSGQGQQIKSLIQKTKKELVNINNNGVCLFKEGKIKQAILVLSEAHERMPENKTIILNMAKILLHDIKTSGGSTEKFARVENAIDSAIKLDVPLEKIITIKTEYNRLAKNQAAQR